MNEVEGEFRSKAEEALIPRRARRARHEGRGPGSARTRVYATPARASSAFPPVPRDAPPSGPLLGMREKAGRRAISQEIDQ